MTRRLLPFPILLSLFLGLPFLTPASARAADPTMGQDEVTLKNGGTVRGTVVATEPGVSVKIIELGGTEARTIPWAQVGDVERGKFAPKPAPESRAQPGTAGPGYAQPVPVPVQAPVATVATFNPPKVPVRLHIDSPVPVEVFSHEKSYGRVGWGYAFTIDKATPVCASPCDEVFDAASGETYTAKGDFGSTPSFSLIGQKGDVELSVSPGSRGGRAGGIVLTTLGGAAILGGGLVALFGSESNAVSGQSGSGNGTMTAGLAVAGVGAVALVAGIVVIVTSKTQLDIHPLSSTHNQAGVAPRPRYWAGEF